MACAPVRTERESLGDMTAIMVSTFSSNEARRGLGESGCHGCPECFQSSTSCL